MPLTVADVRGRLTQAGFTLRDSRATVLCKLPATIQTFRSNGGRSDKDQDEGTFVIVLIALHRPSEITNRNTIGLYKTRPKCISRETARGTIQLMQTISKVDAFIRKALRSITTCSPPSTRTEMAFAH